MCEYFCILFIIKMKSYLLFSAIICSAISTTFPLSSPELSFECGSTTLPFVVDLRRPPPRQHQQQQSKVRSSSESAPNAWPWMALLGEGSSVSVRGQSQRRKLWFCGGALISDQWVLTGARCLDRPTFFVRLGEHLIGSRSSESSGVDYSVENYVIHPEYLPEYGYHDVALVKLSTTVVFKDSIQPICLPWSTGALTDDEFTGLINPRLGPPAGGGGKGSSYSNLEGQDAFITGWGATQLGAESSPILREAKIKIQNSKTCRTNYRNHDREKFGKMFPLGISNQLIICAGDERGTDTCNGDSGGPLSVKDTSGKFVIVGIIASGIGCGIPDLPGLYNPVTPSLDWIKRVAFVSSCSVHKDCSDSERCFAATCINPCEDTCGQGAVCNVLEWKAVCSCPTGFSGNPLVSCTVPISSTSGGDPCKPGPCGPNTICKPVTLRDGRKEGVCLCIDGYKGDPYQICRPQNGSDDRRYSTAAPHYTTAAPHYSTAAPHYTTAAPHYSTAAPHYTTAAPHYSTAAPRYTTRRPSCKAGFTDIGTGCILAHKWIDLGWKASRTYCQEEGGDLVTFKDPNEFLAIIQYIGKIDTRNIGLLGFWLGGNDEVHEGNWKWFDGTTMPMGAPYWGTHNTEAEPAGGRHENCAFFYPQDRFYLHDIPCDPSTIGLKIAPVCYYRFSSY